MGFSLRLPKGKLDKLGIKTVYLFGSQAQKTTGPLSDFDFGILLEDPNILNEAERKIKLYNELYDIFISKIKKFVTIDIVFLDQATLQLQYQAIKHGEVLYPPYPANLKITADFKQRVLERYLDFAPLRREFDKFILERI